MTELPQAFAARIRAQLGAEADAYFAAMEQPSLRGLRFNPLKPVSADVDGLGEPIPWEPNGRYLSAESTAGAHPLHEAGAYYLQEPSAMIPATLLAVQPGEAVLDLCAAPGGKSTQLAAAMQGRGLLVCNEPVPSRAQILSRNLERMGATNALAVSADPSALEKAWPLLFDAILVDAPCSGEGMFRRHPETRAEWTEASPTFCAERQRRILESALKMLKVGGRLCYSTCTLNREENDDLVAALLQAHPELEAVDFSLPIGGGRMLHSQNGGLHLYPHVIRGEGHFAALFRKVGADADDASKPCGLLNAGDALRRPDKAQLGAYQAFCAATMPDALPANAVFGDTLLCAPNLPPLKGVKVLRAGVSLGLCKGKVFVPDHALAMAAPRPPTPTVALDEAQARLYQRGETLPSELRGFATVTLNGLALGWVKGSDGILKNHYPKGLRRP